MDPCTLTILYLGYILASTLDYSERIQDRWSASVSDSFSVSMDKDESRSIVLTATKGDRLGKNADSHTFQFFCKLSKMNPPFNWKSIKQNYRSDFIILGGM